MTKKNLFSLLKQFVIIISSGLIFYSCCTKVQCLNAFDMKEIKLTGFTKQETEEILVSSYVQGEGFLNLVDSASTSARSRSGNDDGELIIFVPIDFSSKLDYIIRFKTDGLVYKINGINTTMKKCNTCFLTEDNYQVMTNYKINGQQQSKSYFELEKQ